MTMASEMTRLAAEFEAEQAARIGAVIGIQSAVRQDLAAARGALQRTMAGLATVLKADLRGIFSEAAIIRGRAEDLIDRFAAEREGNAEALRAELEGYVSDLQSSVEKLLAEHARAREAMGTREAAARAAYLQDLRARLQALLAAAGKFMDGLQQDRMRAERIWRQHLRGQKKQRRDAARQAATGAEVARPAPARREPAPAREPAVQEAVAAAKEARPDDLTEIKGIGAAMQNKLNILGIATFRDLATADADKLTEDIKVSQPMISKSQVEAWIVAARGRA